MIVSEIYGLKSRNGEKLEIFSKFLDHPVETLWPILTVLQQNVRTAQVCALHTGPHLASLIKIEMVAVLCTNETTPQFFEFLTPPPPANQEPMGTTGGGGTSADIVPIQIIFGVDPCTRC